MKVYDLHCDTIGRIYEAGLKGEQVFLDENAFHLDLNKMKKGDYALQVFALFVYKAGTYSCFGTAQAMLKIFKDELAKNSSKIGQVYTWQDVEANERAGRMSAVLSLEEGAIFENSPEDLQWFYEQGARIATFTWNFENELAYPNIMKDAEKDHPWSIGNIKGLKNRGFERLEQMESLHMIPDVSHLSDGGFWDIANHTKRPFMASHSNARGAAPEAARNLTDEMIRALADKGGLMGLNYCVSFVRENWKPGEDGATFDELIRQAKYIMNVGGEDCLGLGSDFDGIGEVPEMKNAAGMPFLCEAMEKAGMPHTQIEKIFHGNARRFLKENL